MVKTAKKIVALSKQYKARIPSEDEMVRKLKGAGMITSATSGRGKNTQRSQMLAEFAHLLASRPAGIRQISRLVVDWTRIVEARIGIGNELPMQYADKPLFYGVMDALFPPEVSEAAKAAYDALYSE